MKYPKKSDRYDRDHRRLEGKKYRLEIVKAVLSFIGIGVSLFMAYSGYTNIMNQWERDRLAAYKGALYDLLSAESSNNRVGLREIARYEEYYAESLPVFVRLLATSDSSKFEDLKNDIVISAAAIGPPLAGHLVQYLNPANASDSIPYSRMQWLLTELIRSNGNGTEPIALAGIRLSTGDLKNGTIGKLTVRDSEIEGLSFDNSRLTECEFTNTVFRKCSFWNATVAATVALDHVTFEDCTFVGSTLNTDLDNAVFVSCDVLDLRVRDFHADNFKDCMNDTTMIKL